MNISKSKIFLFGCLVFIIGVAIASFLPIRWMEHDLWWFAGMMGCAVVLILFWLIKKEGKQMFVYLLFLFLIFLFLGLWRYSLSLPESTPDKTWYYNGQTVTVVGAVNSEPDIRQKSQKLEIKVETLHNMKGSEPWQRGLAMADVKGKILVTTSLYPSYNYGDELEISCELKTPEKFRGFSYDRYLARYDIYSVCYYPKIKLLDREQGSWFYKNIFKFKNKLRQLIDYGLSEPEASLARAIILGDKKGITNELREKFAQAGISHIIAISGMHISILAALVMGALLSLGLARRRAFYLASLFLLIYIILIGLPASAMRAGLMGFLVLWAMNLGRLNKLTNSLVLAAVILLLINPKLLRDDIGFQLSFLAVLGIAYFYPILNNWTEKIFKKLPKFFLSAGALINITLAAQIFTLPIIAINFSQVSVISLISNLLILWILPLLMAAVLLGIGLSLILTSYGFLFFLPALILLKYIIFITDWLVKIPYAYVEVDYLWWGWAIIYYLAVGWALHHYQQKN